MIQVDVAPDSSENSTDTGRLILNGQVIEASDADLSDGQLVVWVTDKNAVLLLLQCQLAEIAHYFASLHFPILVPLLSPPNDYLDNVSLFVNSRNVANSIEFRIGYNVDLTTWVKPWSFSELSSEVSKVIENRYKSEFFDFRLVNDLSGHWHFRFQQPVEEQSLQQVLDQWLPAIRDAIEEANALLTANLHQGAVVALFQFAPEVKAVCQQYLLYFVQFLQDLGIQATADIQEQARGVLFTVTPESGPEALGRIREALDVYLQMPQRPDFDAEITRHRDIAVQQLSANVLHLRSQLALAQAILETKNATIEALQAANLQYKHLLSANPQSQAQLPAHRSDNTQRDEPLLGGAIMLGKYTWKGVQVDLAHILRELRRRWRGED